MRAISSVKAIDAAGAAQDGPTDATDGSPSALDTLVGTKTTGGALQVTIAGGGRGVTVVACLLATLAVSVSLLSRVSCHVERCPFH